MTACDDDRDNLQPGDRVLLVVDNDVAFSRFMVDTAHERGFKAIATSFGAAALALARERRPDAITLDINLPDMDGWRVLDRLKHDIQTRHVPVYVITTEEEHARWLALGAIGVLNKPIQSKDALDGVFDAVTGRLADGPREVALLSPGDERDTIAGILRDGDICVQPARSWAELEQMLAASAPACIVIDAAGEAVAQLATAARGTILPADVPLIVYAPSGLSRKQERDRKRVRRPHRVALSPERLVDEVMLALHRRVETMTPAHQAVVERLYRGDSVFAGRKVLIVDDDIRNIFALTSVLESHQMTVVPAETGNEAIERLQHTPGIDIVLMDIMMPSMDGYDTMRAIRQTPGFRNLPIVAVTAKAMKGDREKCIEAGAWDYLSKPVDAEQLLTVFRTWLHR